MLTVYESVSVVVTWPYFLQARYVLYQLNPFPALKMEERSFQVSVHIYQNTRRTTPEE
jgi:hypothetical protein